MGKILSIIFILTASSGLHSQPAVSYQWKQLGSSVGQYASDPNKNNMGNSTSISSPVVSPLKKQSDFLKLVVGELKQKVKDNDHCQNSIITELEFASNPSQYVKPWSDALASQFMNEHMLRAEKGFFGERLDDAFCPEFSNTLQKVLLGNKFKFQKGSNETKYKDLLMVMFQPPMEKASENEIIYFVYSPDPITGLNFEISDPFISVNALKMLSLYPSTRARDLLVQYLASSKTFEDDLSANDFNKLYFDVYIEKTYWATVFLFNRINLFGYNNEASKTIADISKIGLLAAGNTYKQGKIWGQIRHKRPISAAIGLTVFKLCNKLVKTELPTPELEPKFTSFEERREYRLTLALAQEFKNLQSKAKVIQQDWFALTTDPIMDDMAYAVVTRPLIEIVMQVALFGLFDGIRSTQDAKLATMAERRSGWVTYKLTQYRPIEEVLGTESGVNRTRILAKNTLKNSEIENGEIPNEEPAGSPNITRQPTYPIPGGGDGGIDVMTKVPTRTQTQIKINKTNITNPTTSNKIIYNKTPNTNISAIASLSNNLVVSQAYNSEDQNSLHPKRTVYSDGIEYVSDDGGITYKRANIISSQRYWLVDKKMIEIPVKIVYDHDNDTHYIEPSEGIVIKEEYYDSPENKHIKSEELYKDGKLHGVVTYYYYNGMVEKEERYKNGVLDGTLDSYDKNGKLTFSTNYKDGVMDGISSVYDTNGKLWSQSVYKKGQLFCTFTYHEDGKTLKEQITFDKKSKEAQHDTFDKDGNRIKRQTFDKQGNPITYWYYDNGVYSEPMNPNKAKEPKNLFNNPRNIQQIKNAALQYLGDKGDPKDTVGEVVKKALDVFNSKKPRYALTEKETNMLFGENGKLGVLDYLKGTVLEAQERGNEFPIQLIRFLGLDVNTDTISRSYGRKNKILSEYVEKLIKSVIKKRDISFMLSTDFFGQLIKEGSTKTPLAWISAQYLIEELKPSQNKFTPAQKYTYESATGALNSTEHSFKKSVLNIDLPTLGYDLEDFLGKTHNDNVNIDFDYVYELAVGAAAKILGFSSLQTKEIELLIDSTSSLQNGLLYFLIDDVERSIEVAHPFKAQIVLLADLLDDNVDVISQNRALYIKYVRYRKIISSMSLNDNVKGTNIIERYKKELKKNK